jgi:hypothetical protein
MAEQEAPVGEADYLAWMEKAFSPPAPPRHRCRSCCGLQDEDAVVVDYELGVLLGDVRALDDEVVRLGAPYQKGTSGRRHYQLRAEAAAGQVDEDETAFELARGAESGTSSGFGFMETAK